MLPRSPLISDNEEHYPAYTMATNETIRFKSAINRLMLFFLPFKIYVFHKKWLSELFNVSCCDVLPR